MNYKENYELWLKKVSDPYLKNELLSIERDEEKIKERFSNELKFGTAGLRGIIAAGSGCMNIYTVRRATQGLVDYINERFGGGSVAIAYDSRRFSVEFAREAASVLAANGVEAHLFTELEPTPVLSFAVRELKAKAGIMITASHNPAAYNGYKVYGSDGCQMTTQDADAVYRRIEKVDVFDAVRTVDFDDALANGKIKYIGKQLLRRYYDAVSACRVIEDSCRRYPLKVVYTPLNGAGNLPVREMLYEIGAGEVIVVPEQEMPDENFTTCPYPNPEMRDALSLGLSLCEKEKPDILIATDPDCDRVGVAVRDKGEYVILTGNEVGVLLLNYLVTARVEKSKMPPEPVAVRSVVSSALADDVAKKAGVDMRVVLTGFKFIGEQILLLEQKGKANSFIFGFEESCGYLAGSYVRDKDGVLAAVLICEMTSYYKGKNMTLLAVLDELYAEFGFYRHRVLNIVFSGADAGEKMTGKMNVIRTECPEIIAGHKVKQFLDFERNESKDLFTGETSPIGMPASDIVEFVLENGAKIMIRPSGTEPKIKVYLTAKQGSASASEAMLDTLAEFSEGLFRE